MDKGEWLAEAFEAHRTRLRAAAYRMLSLRAEADDAVQEAWLRLSRAVTSEVKNLGGMANHHRRAGVLGHAALPRIAPRRTAAADPAAWKTAPTIEALWRLAVAH